MITKLSHTSFFVDDQDKAFDFYVNKLGFKVNTDVTMENGFRWLTLNTPEQPDLEIILMSPLHDGMQNDEDTKNAFKTLLEKQALGTGAFYTPDCRATYEEIKAKGVEFKGKHKEQI